jgi:hypothetical protein
MLRYYTCVEHRQSVTHFRLQHSWLAGMIFW